MTRKFEYFSNLSLKTRIYNLGRRLFRLPLLEAYLMRKTRGKDPTSFWAKLVPPEYLYRSGSLRRILINDIVYQLDLSDTVEHFIFFGFSDRAFERLMSYVNATSIVVDVGSNIGRFALPFAKFAHRGGVISFEPDRENFLKLQTNIKLNEFANVTALNKAVGDVQAVKRLFRVNRHNAGMNRFLTDNYPGETAGAQIEVVTLDHTLESMTIGKLDIIKIDVEGFEYRILLGAEKVISRFRPIIFIELVDENLRDNNDSPGKIITWLQLRNYHIFRASDMQSLDSNSDLSNCHFDVLCLPGEVSTLNI